MKTVCKYSLQHCVCMACTVDDCAIVYAIGCSNRDNQCMYVSMFAMAELIAVSVFLTIVKL
jgi:hypothetical protein